ncbi:ABC transporter substrate-binding protein [Actinorugispora endophytica]|uniref:Amino acid/amide ABC transporter substrate-binding protein (HAAT family) n=1 Tax=Actinorugispora endophytica TaxID=1605990 RepID=A0A4R6UG18_9ACTN|nr:ABC transporter substrate-binding protein [Actinorugispora endophytica]TDQ45741.1 amino acid/amide ABC transporter substrate-binding protein (HAAT family) [Actinorugispora endophytica]
MRKPTAALAGALALALLATSCSGAGQTEGGGVGDLDVSTGVTDDTVVIGTHQPLTGPASAGYLSISQGATAMFDYINAQGGVHGRRIDYRVQDDVYDPTQTIEVTQELVMGEEIFAMLGGLGTPTHSKVVDYLNEEGVPDVFVSSGALMWNNPEEYPLTYGYQVDYTKEAKILGQYVAENFPDAKVGYFYQNDDVGTDSQAGLDQYLADMVVSDQRYEATAPEAVATQIAALKEDGADLVVCACIPSFTALGVLNAAGQDYHPQWVVSSIGSDVPTLKNLLREFGESDELPVEAMLNGMITSGYLPATNMEDDPWTRFYQEVHEEYGAEGELTNTTIYGMVQATMFARALKAAGPEPTRQGLVDALESMEWNGPGVVPFASSADDHGGYAGALINQYVAEGDEEGLEELQGPMVTDREGGDITEGAFDRATPEEYDFHD